MVAFLGGWVALGLFGFVVAWVIAVIAWIIATGLNLGDLGWQGVARIIIACFALIPCILFIAMGGLIFLIPVPICIFHIGKGIREMIDGRIRYEKDHSRTSTS